MHIIAKILSHLQSKTFAAITPKISYENIKKI